MDNETMSGFVAYQTYLAVNNHFTRKTYDFFKYNGKVNVKASSYEARRDKYMFEKFARRYKRTDYVKFLVSNFVQTNDRWIGNLLNVKADLTLKKWKKYNESFSYSFKEEMANLSDTAEDFDALFKFEDGKHPLLYRMYLRNKLSLEAATVLDDLVGYSARWERKGDMMLNEFTSLMQNYRPFLHNLSSPDMKKLKKIVLDEFSG